MPTLIQELHSLERLTLRWAGAIDHQDPRFGCLSTIAMITVELRNSEGVRPIGEPFSRTVAHFENCQYTPNLTEMDMLWIMLVCSYDVKTSPSFSFDILPPKFRLLEDTLFQKLNTAFGEFFFHFFQLKVALYKLQESSQTHIIFYRAACFLDKCCCLPLQSTWLSIAVCNALRINITQILLESPFRHQPTIPSNDTSSRPTQRLIAHTETPQTTVVEVDASNVEVSDHLVTDCRSEERHCSEHYAESPIAEDSPIAVHPKNTGHQIPRKRKASPSFDQERLTTITQMGSQARNLFDLAHTLLKKGETQVLKKSDLRQAFQDKFGRGPNASWMAFVKTSACFTKSHLELEHDTSCCGHGDSIAIGTPPQSTPSPPPSPFLSSVPQ